MQAWTTLRREKPLRATRKLALMTQRDAVLAEVAEFARALGRDGAQLREKLAG